MDCFGHDRINNFMLFTKPKAIMWKIRLIGDEKSNRGATMILFDLICAEDHVFEAWFRDSETYDAQAASGEIECPLCGGSHITKALMTPNIARSAETGDPGQAAQMMRQLRAMHEEITKHSDDVGEKFPEEARKIHYGETEKRNIHGRADLADARALDEEGIEFGILPPLPRRKDN